VSDVYELEGEFKRLGVENANLRAENATMMEQLLHYERLLTANEAMANERIATIELKLTRLSGFAKDHARLSRERDELLAAAKDVLACDKALSDARVWNEGHIEERMVAELRMVQSFAPLHLAVAACGGNNDRQGD
jgi:hypothetical protein